MCISFEKAQYSVMNINPYSKKIQWKYPYQRETPKNRPGLSKVIVLVLALKVAKKQGRGKRYVQWGKTVNPWWKLSWFRQSRHSVLEVSENMGCVLRPRCSFPLFSICSVDLGILCSGSFSHFLFLQEISTRMVCVNGKHLKSFPGR